MSIEMTSLHMSGTILRAWVLEIAGKALSRESLFRLVDAMWLASSQHSSSHILLTMTEFTLKLWAKTKLPEAWEISQWVEGLAVQHEGLNLGVINV